MGAVCYGRAEMVQKILAAGADKNAVDNYGMSASDYARKMHKKSMQELLGS